MCGTCVSVRVRVRSDERAHAQLYERFAMSWGDVIRRGTMEARPFSSRPLARYPDVLRHRTGPMWPYRAAV